MCIHCRPHYLRYIGITQRDKKDLGFAKIFVATENAAITVASSVAASVC